MSKHVSVETAIVTAFPNIQATDILDAIEAAKWVDTRIIGRVCGNYGDKISQYLSIASYFRSTGSSSFDSLEIGTLFGGSCIIKLMAMKNLGIKGRILCIDPMTGYYGNFLDPLSGIPVIPEMFWANIKKFGFSQQDVELILYKSNVASAMEPINGMKFATIMIDGDHSYQGVSYDWDHFSQYIANDGFVLIDDFAEASWPEITSFAGSCLGPNISAEWRDGGVLGSTYVLQKTHQSYTPTKEKIDTLANIFLPEEVAFALNLNTLHIRLADTYLKLGLPEEAEKLYVAVLNANRAFFETHTFLAKLGLAALYVDHRPENTKAILAELQAIKIPEFAYTIRTVITLGSLLGKISDPHTAISLYSDSLIYLPLPYLDRFFVMQKIAELEMKHGDQNKARRIIQCSLLLPGIQSKEKIIAIQTLCNYFIKINQLEMAQNLLEQNLNSPIPYSIEERGALHQLIGHIFGKYNDHTQAIINYSKAIEALPSKHPLYVHCLLGAGYAFFKLGNFVEASKLISKALEIPNAAEFNRKAAYTALYDCYYSQGDYTAANKVKEIADQF